ncbi:MAG: redoxin domain-containing protein [Rickettsiales bacterium]
MRNLILSFITLLYIAIAQPAVADINPGDAAPDFTAKAADGSDVTLASLKGKTIVLEWANYECPFSKMHYESGNLPSLQETYTGKGVTWLTVLSSAPGKQGYYSLSDAPARNEQMKNHATHVLLDATGTIGKLYGAKTTPHLYVIDAGGIVQYNGAIDSIPSVDAKTLAEARPLAANAIDAVLAGKKPEMASNQAYGCSIKYAD